MVFNPAFDEPSNAFELQKLHYEIVYGKNNWTINKEKPDENRDSLTIQIPECKDCHTSSGLVEDRKAGTLVCGDCGLVLEIGVIDLGQEWRTFSGDDEKPGADMNRTGESSDIGRGDQLKTIIAGGDGQYAKSLQHAQGQSSLYTEEDKANKKLREAIPKMIQYIDMFNLSHIAGMREVAEELLLWCHQKGAVNFTPKDTEIAAIVYLAGKNTNAALSLSNIYEKAYGSDKKMKAAFKRAMKAVRETTMTMELDKKAEKEAHEKELLALREGMIQKKKYHKEEMIRFTEAAKDGNSNAYVVPSSRRAKVQHGPTEEELQALQDKHKEDTLVAQQQALIAQSIASVQARDSGVPGEETEDFRPHEGDCKNFSLIIQQAKDFIGKWIDGALFGQVPYWIKEICNDLLDAINDIQVYPSRRPEYIACATLWIALALIGKRVPMKNLHQYPGMPKPMAFSKFAGRSIFSISDG